MRTDKIYTCCLVCGFDFNRALDPDDDCPCCGGHIGYCMPDKTPDDITRKVAREYRQDWFEKGAIWGDGVEYQPEGWNMQMALKQIEDNVPEEFK